MQINAPAGSSGPMLLLLTGDGNWAAFPRALADSAARNGSPVLALLSRAYMTKGPAVTPDRLAADLATAARRQLGVWHRQSLVIVGYSRGADWLPFVLNRWPADLRKRVTSVAFVGLANAASFQFHLEDLFRDVKRPSDIPVAPEMERLEGMAMICIYGTEEAHSFCRHPIAGMKTLEHAGGHRVKDNPPLIAWLLGELGIGPKTAPPPP